MAEPHETRIVHDTKNGRLSIVHPPSGQKVETGMKAEAHPEARDRQIRAVKEQLEKAGNRVSYREV
jgi:hypothetical protein